MSASEIIHAQVEAFNAHDVEGFVATYAEDTVVMGVAPEPLAGRQALREFYGARLRNGTLFCEVRSLVCFGARWVVAHEVVSDDTTSTETVATFEVVDGLIRRSSIVKG